MGKRISTLFSAMLAATALLPNVASAQTASSGGPYTLPYSELWNDQTVLKTNEWTIEDNNNDDITWTFTDSPGSSILYNGTNQTSNADDWLVSPYLALTAGKTYKIETGAYKSGANQKVSVAFGLGDDPTTYTECVSTVTVNGTMLGGNATKINGTFTPATSGNYRVAFHCTSNTRGYLILLPVRVYEAEAEDVRPAAVTDLNVEVGAKGALSSKVTFTIPSTTAKGDALTSLTRVQIYRDNTPDAIKTYENPTPGDKIEWQDESVESGEHVYTVVSTANDLRSDEASKTAYVGVDTPKAPQNFKIYDNLDGTLKFTWDATTENSGEHGGYVDTSESYYHVYSLSYGYLQKVGDDSEGLTSPEYTVKGITYDGSQGAIQYVVYAMTNTPTDTLAQSKAARLEYIQGKPHSIPFYESFPNKSIQAGPWAIDAGKSGRFGFSDDAQDNDGGSLQFDPSQTATEALLRGPKVDISNAANPQLVLWYYAYPGSDSKFSVIINRNGQTETTVGTIDYSTLTGAEGWRTESFDLKALSTAGTENGYIRPYFLAEGTKTSVQLDNIKIYDAVDNNIEATIDAPAHVQNGKVCGVTVKVTNLGLATAKGYKVNFYVNGNKTETVDGDDLAPNAEQEYEFSFTPALNSSYFTVQGEAEWAADQMDENNVTDEKLVELTCSNLPKIDDLAATLDGNNANVTWSAMDPDGKEITENFDNFTPWAISAVGDWTLYDGDKAPTYAFGGIEYPHQGEAGSYIVFNPWQTTGLSGNDLERFIKIFRPHSGRQAMMSVGATVDTGTPTNDWLITPELSGDEQTISFWTCAPNDEVTAGSSTPNAGPETFDVYYSEDDTNVNSFIKINKDSYEATCNWTKFDIDVPEGAKYFAIVRTSTGGGSSYGYEPNRFLVDDVTYRAGGLRVMGYNVYRDGMIAKRLDSKTTSWVDEKASEDGGTHYYNVMVVYANGESDASNTAGVGNWTGINDVNSDNLILGGAVYNLSGQKVADSLKNVKGGIFIQNGKKVVVK